MRINYFGDTKNIDIPMMERYIKFSAYELMGVEVTNECVLDVHFGDAGCFDAQVEVDEIDVELPNPRHFNMYIGDNIKDGYELHMTVGHEMVHVKQFALNELRENEAARLCWKGEEFPKTMSRAEYYNAPWEMEAYGKENGLYWACTEHYEMLDKLVEIAKNG